MNNLTNEYLAKYTVDYLSVQVSAIEAGSPPLVVSGPDGVSDTPGHLK